MPDGFTDGVPDGSTAGFAAGQGAGYPAQAGWGGPGETGNGGVPQEGYPAPSGYPGEAGHPQEAAYGTYPGFPGAAQAAGQEQGEPAAFAGRFAPSGHSGQAEYQAGYESCPDYAGYPGYPGAEAEFPAGTPAEFPGAAPAGATADGTDPDGGFRAEFETEFAGSAEFTPFTDGAGEQDLAQDAALPEPEEPAESREREEPAPAAAGGREELAARRGRRRSIRPRARSAFFSVAAPSLAVLGVTAVATAATVSETETGSEDRAPVAAPDPSEVEELPANQEFDTQLVSLSAAAGDYAERASLTQGQLDLQAQHEAEERAAEEEAERQEALRPKFFLPVEQHGLSAYFGQAGVNWMSVHTGIDFPVSWGTPVMAATDGTIRTQWNVSYGNMLILTAPDGTETWYCHLSSTVYQSGSVQAGTVIAYSGNSGNSTGPHLHFEVRPGGGSAIDPLPWLREHGLEPT
ncbi:M23 family peptidase [Streptomyces hoynatensis]|uniref:M23 family peptidase n=1 Tax=Streptomyces hoynatensis TaxID=1141874 RepID=A0A3A9ZFZ8_9ACTN|nr:M23 family peptidase [Streptomyces hoynatensis]